MPELSNNKNQKVHWEALSAEDQLELRMEHQKWLDLQPPTCSMDTKIERFRHWLAERDIVYGS